MDADSKGQRKMEDSGGGLLPAVEGHSLEQNNHIEKHSLTFFTISSLLQTVSKTLAHVARA